MRKLILVVLMVLILGYLIGIARGEDVNQTQAIYDVIEKSSVQIFLVNDGYCTGTVIYNEENAVVMTCKHCIAPNEETWADELKTKLIISSANDDLAYLIMNGNYTDKIPATLARYNAYIGSDIYIYGKQGLVHTFPQQGKIIRYTNDWGWAEFYAIGGTSGSGVYNNKAELIGVLWGGMNDRGKEIMVFEPLSDIKNFLEEVEQIIK